MLTELAGKLTDGRIELIQARNKTNETVAGFYHHVGNERQRVIPSIAAVQRELMEIAEYVKNLSKLDPKRWAATLVLVYAQDALELVDPLRRTVGSVISVSRGVCPVGMNHIAVAMIDVALEHADYLSDAEVEAFSQARTVFLRLPR